MKTFKVASFVAFLLLSIQMNGQKLESGTVLGYHTGEFTLAEGVTSTQFENFMTEEYLPALEKHFPGMKLYLLKGERGEHINKPIDSTSMDSFLIEYSCHGEVFYQYFEGRSNSVS